MAREIRLNAFDMNCVILRDRERRIFSDPSNIHEIQHQATRPSEAQPAPNWLSEFKRGTP